MKTDNEIIKNDTNDDTLDTVLDSLANDDNEIVDGKTKEEENLTDADIEAMAKEIMTDDEFKSVYGEDALKPEDDAKPKDNDVKKEERDEYEDKILTERVINKMKRQAREKEEEEKRQLEFLSWYYNYQLQEYRNSHGFDMEGRLKRQLRKRISRDWTNGKLKKLYNSNLN